MTERVAHEVDRRGLFARDFAPASDGSNTTASNNTDGAAESAWSMAIGLPALLFTPSIVGAITASYAKMLHKAHGKSFGDTMKLGMTVGATPMITEAVDAVRVKGAGALAPLVPLDGKEFEIAYLDVMVKDHTEVLAMIDGQLMPAAKKDAVKKHLAATRGHVAMHLEEAKKLQGMKR